MGATLRCNLPPCSWHVLYRCTDTWCFTPSQPLRVISGRNKMYSYHKWKFWFNIPYTFHHSGKFRENEVECRNEVGKSPVIRHSMQSYIPTYFRFRKRKPLITLGSHQEGALNFCIRSTPPWGGADLDTLALRRWSQTAWSPFTTRAVSVLCRSTCILW